MTNDAPRLEDFPARTSDKLRYGDTDRQGHVNNAVYSTFFETGRVEMLHAGDVPPPEGKAFVIARVTIDFQREVNWPGEVEIGTGVAAIGNSSIRPLIDFDLVEHVPGTEDRLTLSARGRATWEHFLAAGGEFPEDLPPF